MGDFVKKVFVEVTSSGFPVEKQVMALDAIYSIGLDPSGRAVVNGVIVDEQYDDLLKRLGDFVEVLRA